MAKREREADKKLLVLDLNGVMLDSDRMTARRRGLDAFLSMAFERYHVISWTSQQKYKFDPKGTKKPVCRGDSRVHHAFGRWRPQLLAEMYKAETTDTGLTESMPGYQKPILLKDLNRVLALPAVAERLGREPTSADVVAVDDDPHKLALQVGQPGWTLVFPPSWTKRDVLDDGAMEAGGALYEAVASGKAPLDQKAFDDDATVRKLGGAQAFKQELAHALKARVVSKYFAGEARAGVDRVV